MTKTKHSSASDPSRAARPKSICIDIPRAFSNGGSYAIWKPGGPGRMLGQLAREHATGEATLTPQQLADLLDLFSDEPLPDSLRTAITRHLRGKRKRLSGAPKKGTTNREQVERVMLPGAYKEALMEARAERSQLRTFGRKQSRYDDPDRLPTASAMALEKVRRWLPTLADRDDRRLQNMISEVRAELKDDDAGSAAAPPHSSASGKKQTD